MRIKILSIYCCLQYSPFILRFFCSNLASERKRRDRILLMFLSGYRISSSGKMMYHDEWLHRERFRLLNEIFDTRIKSEVWIGYLKMIYMNKWSDEWFSNSCWEEFIVINIRCTLSVNMMINYNYRIKEKYLEHVINYQWKGYMNINMCFI